jgi:tetratricopeptide (TPR) repeat protein
MPRQMSRQQQQGRMLAPRPPLAAYREDLARHGAREAFGPSDATWISVATVLSHGVNVAAEERPPLLSTLREIVGNDPGLRDVLDAPDEPPSNEFELDRVSPIVRAVVTRMEDDGALNLAYSTLSILVDADLRLSTIERGRVLAQLGRIARYAGALETAREQYRRAEVLGRTARIPELRIRAWVGYSIIARLRGNYPEVRRWASRAVEQAEREGLTQLASLAHHSLMIVAAVSGDLNGALAYGWRAYRGAIGDRSREASALLHLAQTLLEGGHPAPAVRGFIAALDREPVPRVAFPILGGLAIAAAKVGNHPLLGETRARMEKLIASSPFPYEHAGVLLELTQAMATIGDTVAAHACRARALELAHRHSFHEYVHRLESVRIHPVASVAEAPHVLDQTGTEVARAVAALELIGTAKGSL